MKIWKALKVLFFKTDKHNHEKEKTKIKNGTLNSSKIYIGFLINRNSSSKRYCEFIRKMQNMP